MDTNRCNRILHSLSSPPLFFKKVHNTPLLSLLKSMEVPHNSAAFLLLFRDCSDDACLRYAGRPKDYVARSSRQYHFNTIAQYSGDEVSREEVMSTTVLLVPYISIEHTWLLVP